MKESGSLFPGCDMAITLFFADESSLEVFCSSFGGAVTFVVAILPREYSKPESLLQWCFSLSLVMVFRVKFFLSLRFLFACVELSSSSVVCKSSSLFLFVVML